MSPEAASIEFVVKAIGELRAEVVKLAAGPGRLLTVGEARSYLGFAQTSWRTASALPGFPAPVYVPGFKEPRYRRADLDKYVERLKPSRRRRRRTDSLDVTPAPELPADLPSDAASIAE